jgi:uncharacterized protein YukE
VIDAGTPAAAVLCERIEIAATEGDVDALRALAAAVRRTSDETRRQLVTMRQALAGIDAAWRGRARAGLDAPWSSLLQQTVQAADGLDEFARALQGYADQLEDAQRRQRWSWQKVAAIGLTVAVVGGAMVVSGGAAVVTASAAARAAVAIASASSAAAAAGSAAAASVAAFSSLSALAASLQGLAVFALASGVAAGGMDVLAHQFAGEDIDWGSAGTSFAVGTATGVVSAGAMTSVVRYAPVLLRVAPRAAVVAMPYFVDATIDGGSNAIEQQIKTGEIDAGRSAQVALTSLLFSGTARFAEHARLRMFPKVAPTVRRNGIDLRDHEGILGGHTIRVHVGKDERWLRRRLSVERREVVSSFDDLEAANSAVNKAIHAHTDAIAAWRRSRRTSLTLPKFDMGHPVGTVVWRRGSVRSALITVVLRKDALGNVHVHTAYLEAR